MYMYPYVNSEIGKGHSQEILKPRVLKPLGERKSNSVKGFRTRGRGTLFHKMNNDLMTINGIELSGHVLSMPILFY